jgi:hypothetical protein
MFLRTEVYVKYSHLDDFIRLDPAEIRMLVGKFQKTKLHDVYVKYSHLDDSIRLDPAEIRILVGRTPLLAVSA